MVALVVALPTTAAFEEIDECAAEAVACQGEDIGYGEYSGGDAACRASLEAYYDMLQDGYDKCRRYGSLEHDYKCYGEAHEATKDVCCDNDECAELLNCGIEWAQESGDAKEFTTCGSNAALIVVIIIVVLLAVAALIAWLLKRSKNKDAAVREIAPLQQATAAASPHTATSTMHVAHGALPSALPGQPPVKAAISTTNPPTGLDATPGPNVRELRTQAAAAGVTPDAIEEARDADDPKAALLALIAAAKPDPAALQALNLKDLRAKAAAAGVPANQIEDARDGNDPKQELIALIMATVAPPVVYPSMSELQVRAD